MCLHYPLIKAVEIQCSNLPSLMPPFVLNPKNCNGIKFLLFITLYSKLLEFVKFSKWLLL